jgi:hypothetical protein
LLVAIRLGWHMAFRLDKFDWQYSKSEIWGSFILDSLLWPVLFLQPQNLMDPGKLFVYRFSLAARRREEARLWNNPPPCGPVIRYRQGHAGFGETFGELTFKTIDLEETLVARIRQSPHLADGQEGAILNWFRQRDDSILEPSEVPKAWERFENVALTAICDGRADVYCLKCNAQIPKDKQIMDWHSVKPWMFERLVCPLGHPLVVLQSIHLYMRREDSSPEMSRPF